MVLCVLKECKSQGCDGDAYNGNVKKYEKKNKCRIDCGGIEVQILADFIERGGCLRGCTKVLNIRQHEHGKEAVAVSTVHNHAKNYMGSKKKKARKVPQGSLNPYSPWSSSSFKWINSLLSTMACLIHWTIKIH
eukprot:8831048-Ditylum_brightwellii.AAC.1